MIPLLLASTLKGSLLIGAVLLGCWLLKDKLPPRWVHLLLLIGVLRLLVPMAPESSFSIFNLGAGSVGTLPILTGAASVDAVAVSATGIRRPAEKEGTAPIDALPSAVLALWFAGVVLLGTRTIFRTARFHLAVKRTSGGEVSPGLSALVNECRAALAVRRPVRLCTTTSVQSPALYGWLRPTLLLPPHILQSFNPEQLRYVILHELAHLRRSDVLVNWITSVAQALHWFNPLVRMAVTRIAEERELACDALALEQLPLDERSAYGATLLEVVNHARRQIPAPGLVGMTASHSLMKRRILMIASYTPRNHRSIAFAALTAVVVLVTFTDARAGQQMRRIKVGDNLSPQAAATVQSLDKNVDFQHTEASIDQILATVAAQTGVSFRIADGAIDDAARQARITIKATAVPAHIALFETLASLNLAVRFTDSGAEIQKASANGERIRVMHLGDKEIDVHERSHEGDADVKVEKRRVHRSMTPGADGDEKVVVLSPEDGGSEQVIKIIKTHEEGAEPGVTRRKVNFRGGAEGQAEGILELEVRHAATSTRQP